MKKITLGVILAFLFIVGTVTLVGFSSGSESLQNNNINTSPSQVNSKINPPLLDKNTAPNTIQAKPGEITMRDVSGHSSSGDCYLAINGNVYDVSNYINQHPGGRRTITDRCGKEVTNIFARIHSNRAWDILDNYKIGELDTAPEVKNSTNISFDLTAIQEGLVKSNPNAEIVSVKPSQDFYVAKVILENKLYEVHIDKAGDIIKEEVQADELDWSVWDSDTDDLEPIK